MLSHARQYIPSYADISIDASAFDDLESVAIRILASARVSADPLVAAIDDVQRATHVGTLPTEIRLASNQDSFDVAAPLNVVELQPNGSAAAAAVELQAQVLRSVAESLVELSRPESLSPEAAPPPPLSSPQPTAPTPIRARH